MNRKSKHSSMRDNPRFADAYTQHDGKKYFDINKGFALAKKLFAVNSDSVDAKALWGRSKWGIARFKKFKLDQIKGYDNLTTKQQIDFMGILDKFISSQGDDARRNLSIKSVTSNGNDFKIDISRHGRSGYQILHPKSGRWS